MRVPRQGARCAGGYQLGDRPVQALRRCRFGRCRGRLSSRPASGMAARRRPAPCTLPRRRGRRPRHRSTAAPDWPTPPEPSRQHLNPLDRWPAFAPPPAPGPGASRRSAPPTRTVTIKSPGETVPALRDVDLLHDPANGGRYVHRRLLGFESDERRLRFDLLTRLNEHVDNCDVFEVAHIGHAHFDDTCSRVHGISLQIFQGTGLEGSMPSFCMAPVTVF